MRKSFDKITGYIRDQHQAVRDLGYQAIIAFGGIDHVAVQVVPLATESQPATAEDTSAAGLTPTPESSSR